MIDQVNTIAQSWWDWMWPMLWQVSALIVLIAAIDVLIRRWAWPQLRHALWLLVLVKLVLPPDLSLSTSLTSGLHPVAKSALPQRMESSSVVAAEPSFESVLPAAPLADADTLLAARPDMAPDTGLKQTTVSVADAVATAGPALSWQVYVMAVWLLGVMVLIGYLARRLRYLHMRAHAKMDHRSLPPWFAQLFADTAARLKLRRLPEVWVSENIAGPAVFGVFRPVLLLPARHIDSLSRHEAEHVLLHELAHIKRGDLPVHAVCMLLQILYWFNPLLWFVRRQLQHLRELCCDASVARVLRESTTAYRETLLEVARRLLATRVEPGLSFLGLFEDTHRLLNRLEWLEKKTWQYRKLRAVAALAAVAFMLVCVLPMAKAKMDQQDQVPMEKPAPAQSTFSAILPDGSTVELIGVSEHPSTGKQWWRPDGGLLETAPYHTTISPENAGKEIPDYDYEFAIRFDGPHDANFRWLVTHANGTTYTGAPYDKDGVPLGNLHVNSARILNKYKKTDLRIGISTAKWKTVATYSAKGGQQSYGLEEGGIVFNETYQEDGDTVITAAHTFLKLATRMIAVDHDGNTRRPFSTTGGGVTGMVSRIYKYHIPLKSIKEFQFQIRPYEYITFKNVSLKPGRITDVKIEDDSGNERSRRRIETSVRRKLAPIIAHDVELHFADPIARDGSFHSDHSVAFALGLFYNKGLPKEVGPGGMIQVGQTTWLLRVQGDRVIISDGSTGREIGSETWPTGALKFDEVTNLPVKYGNREYRCPVHVELTRRDAEPPTGSYWFCAYLSGRLPSGAGGRTFEIVNVDQQMEFRDARADFHGDPIGDAVLGIDINGDGKIDLAKDGGERLGLYDPFQIKSRTYQVIEVDPYLPRVVFREVADEQPRQKTDVKIAVQNQPTEKATVSTLPFAATLPSGLAVALVGISTHPSSDNSWWQADGKRLGGAPCDPDPPDDNYVPQDRERAYVCLLRLAGLPEESLSIRVKSDPHAGRSGINRTEKHGRQLDDYRKVKLLLDHDSDDCTLRLNIGSGLWETIATYKRFSPRWGWGVGHSGSRREAQFAFSGPAEIEGHTLITVSHDVVDQDCRVIAVDQDDRQHSAFSSGGSGSTEFRQLTLRFDPPPDKIKEYQFQIRPYEYVTFKNVSLKPGKKTEVKIEQGAAPSAKAVTSRPAPEIYIVTFQGKSQFQPWTSKALLDAFNEKHPKGVRTHHYRTKIEEDRLIGLICVDSQQGKEAVIAMLKDSGKLELLAVEP